MNGTPRKIPSTFEIHLAPIRDERGLNWCKKPLWPASRASLP